MDFASSHGVRAGCHPGICRHPVCIGRNCSSASACVSKQPIYRQSSCRRLGGVLDEGRFVLDPYSILLEVRNASRPVPPPHYSKPELLATGPNQCWSSCDITKLKGPVKWSYYYLYVILDIFSRYVVGWMVATQESSRLAKVLIAQSCSKQVIEPGDLTLHADRGSSMSSRALALLLADLGVTKSHSRPHVCDDNPFSESQFKTLNNPEGYSPPMLFTHLLMVSSVTSLLGAKDRHSLEV